MKMAKKLLAVVLAGVLALSVLTGCGNSTGTKSIADAMTDMLKDEEITVKTSSDLSTKVKAIAALHSDPVDGVLKATQDDDEGEDWDIWLDDEAKTAIMKILGDKYKDQFVWVAITPTKGYNTNAQAATMLKYMPELSVNEPENKKSGKTWYIGTTTMTAEGENFRVAIVTAAAADAED